MLYLTIFLLDIRRPPRSTLFPTRRSSDLTFVTARSPRQKAESARRTSSGGSSGPGTSRSEEHTSELQSHSDLVCRLLLEKKKPTYPVTWIYSPTWVLSWSRFPVSDEVIIN